MTAPRTGAGPEPADAADRWVRRWSASLAALLVVEFGVGVAVLVSVPTDRPSGWVPAAGLTLYAIHALLGVAIAAGALRFAVRTARSGRLQRLSGQIGAVGVGVAGAGGLLAVAHPWRLIGLALMLVGPLIAVFGYLIPALDRITDNGTGGGTGDGRG